MDFTHALQPTDPSLFYQRHDPNDVRLGEVVKRSWEDYATATTILIGCPQEEGVVRNKGRLGTAQAPDAIRAALYRLVASTSDTVLLDIGNTLIQPTLEETHTLHSELIQQFIQDGKRVVSLGGGNDLSYADCRGLAMAGQEVLAVNIDAHFDVRADVVRNSGTPYRQLLEEGWIQPDNFYEVGSLPMVNSPIYREYLQHKGAHILDWYSVRKQGIHAVMADILARSAQSIFWGFDMDVVHVADAPGVSAPNSLGLSAFECVEVARLAGQDPRSRVYEITEVNPTFDLDNRTSRLAAVALYEFIYAQSGIEKHVQTD